MFKLIDKENIHNFTLQGGLVKGQLVFEPRSDRRDILAIKVKIEIFTEKERSSCCEQLQKI